MRMSRPRFNFHPHKQNARLVPRAARALGLLLLVLQIVVERPTRAGHPRSHTMRKQAHKNVQTNNATAPWQQWGCSYLFDTKMNANGEPNHKENKDERNCTRARRRNEHVQTNEGSKKGQHAHMAANKSALPMGTHPLVLSCPHISMVPANALGNNSRAATKCARMQCSCEGLLLYLHYERVSRHQHAPRACTSSAMYFFHCSSWIASNADRG